MWFFRYSLFEEERLKRNPHAPKHRPRDHVLLNRPENEPPDLTSVNIERWTERMVAQQMSMTAGTKIMADHDGIITDVFGPALTTSLADKLRIAGASKQAFLAGLRRMNVTAQNLFPGIDGLGRSIAERARLILFTKPA